MLEKSKTRQEKLVQKKWKGISVHLETKYVSKTNPIKKFWPEIRELAQ